MHISLPPDMEQFLAHQIHAGRFSSYDDAVVTALSRMIADDTATAWTKEALDNEIQRGIDDLEAGNIMRSEDIEAHITKRREAWLKSRHA